MSLKRAMNVPERSAYEVDRSAVRAAFNRAAEGYEKAAVLQGRVRDELLERLNLVKLEPLIIVDIGCGPGRAAKELARRYRGTRVIALDLAENMLAAISRGRWFASRTRVYPVCADAVMLPLHERSAELVFCNLMLQWCNDFDAVIAEFLRVLRPGGLLNFTTFGPDTLKELRAAWSEVDGYTHVNQFMDMHDIGDALLRVGLADPVIDVEYYTLTYKDILDLMRDLKRIGAHNVTLGRRRGIMGRKRLTALQSSYERFRQAGRLPATYEVIFGQAWAPRLGARPIEGGDAEVRIPIGEVSRRLD